MSEEKVLNVIRKSISEMVQDVAQIYDASLSSIVEMLEQDLTNLNIGDSATFIRALSSLESTSAYIDMLMCTTHLNTKIATFSTKILSKLKSVSMCIWQLISRSIQLDTWSVSGDLSVKPFGLGGTVRLSLTFKP